MAQTIHHGWMYTQIQPPRGDNFNYTAQIGQADTSPPFWHNQGAILRLISELLQNQVGLQSFFAGAEDLMRFYVLSLPNKARPRLRENHISRQTRYSRNLRHASLGTPYVVHTRMIWYSVFISHCPFCFDQMRSSYWLIWSNQRLLLAHLVKTKRTMTDERATDTVLTQSRNRIKRNLLGDPHDHYW